MNPCAMNSVPVPIVHLDGVAAQIAVNPGQLFGFFVGVNATCEQTHAAKNDKE